MAADKKGITSREGDNGSVYSARKNAITIPVWGGVGEEKLKMERLIFGWMEKQAGLIFCLFPRTIRSIGHQGTAIEE